jgi:hypothetical protein
MPPVQVPITPVPSPHTRPHSRACFSIHLLSLYPLNTILLSLGLATISFSAFRGRGGGIRNGGVESEKEAEIGSEKEGKGKHGCREEQPADVGL